MSGKVRASKSDKQLQEMSDNFTAPSTKKTDCPMVVLSIFKLFINWHNNYMQNEQVSLLTISKVSHWNEMQD